MDIQAIYMISSAGESMYSKTIQYVTSGVITHVGLVFFVSNDVNIDIPIDTSPDNIENWLNINDIRSNDTLDIKIPEFGETLSLSSGAYVFETTNDIRNKTNYPVIIKRDKQSSGCVITPIKTYMAVYKKNYIIKLTNDKEVLKSLIRRYWGRAYGIDSILSNLSSKESMVCTHLTERYINIVYSRNYSTISPTELTVKVEKLVGQEYVYIDDFIDRKKTNIHTMLFLMLLISGAIVVFSGFVRMSLKKSNG